MPINSISSLLSYISSNQAVPSNTASDSALIESIREQTRLSDTGDVLSLRLSNLRSRFRDLYESKIDVETLQAKKTINQIVSGAISYIESEAGKIKSLINEVNSGDFTDSQVADAQLQIESRLALIDLKASETNFNSEPLLTGEPVKITLEPQSGEGFSVEFSDISASGLELAAIDISTDESRASALESINTALSITATVSESIDLSNSVLGKAITESVSGFEDSFKSLSETGALNTSGDPNKIRIDPGKLSSGFGNLNSSGMGLDLTSELVSTLLKG